MTLQDRYPQGRHQQVGEAGPADPVPRPGARREARPRGPRPAVGDPRLRRRGLPRRRDRGRGGPVALSGRLRHQGDPPRAHREEQGLRLLLPHGQGPEPEHAHAPADDGPRLYRHRLREDRRREGPPRPLLRQLRRPRRHDRHALGPGPAPRRGGTGQSVHGARADPPLPEPGRGQGGGRRSWAGRSSATACPGSWGRRLSGSSATATSPRAPRRSSTSCPSKTVRPADVPRLVERGAGAPGRLYKVVFHEEDMVRPVGPGQALRPPGFLRESAGPTVR